MRAAKLIRGRVTRTGGGGSRKARGGTRVLGLGRSAGFRAARDRLAQTQRRTTLRTKR